jgi:hypothetical protein
MKYIVPLFRQNTGRVNLGLLNWDSFQAGFRMLMRGDKFAGVIWDPWWRERKSEARRNGQRRTIPERRSHDKARQRLYSEGESVQPLRLVHEKRTNWERRDGSDRRKSASRFACGQGSLRERSTIVGFTIRPLSHFSKNQLGKKKKIAKNSQNMQLRAF